MNGDGTAREPLFRALATSAAVGIYEIDPDGRFVFVSDRWCALAGIAADEALGHDWDHVIHPDDREAVVAEWNASVAEQREFAIEYRYVRPDGRQVWVDGRAVAVHDPEGEPLAFLGSVVEVHGAAREPASCGSPGGDRRLPGTGLGLTIVKAIVDAHEARIGVDSEPGRGTTVRVELLWRLLRDRPRNADG